MSSTAYPSSAEPTRAKIVRAARALYLEAGADALSMRRIAERAGLGTMTTYRHFENKEALLAEIAGGGFDLFSAFMYRALEAPSAAERLWQCGDQFLAFALEHPRYYEAMFTFDLPEDSAAQRMSAAHRFLADRVGEVAGVDEAKATALSLFALCHGMVTLHLARRYEPQVDFPNLFRRTLLRALRSSGLVPDNFQPTEVS